jgi:hypothetical protein
MGPKEINPLKEGTDAIKEAGGLNIWRMRRHSEIV